MRLMFIAHAPSGYILAIALLERVRRVSLPTSATILAGMIGAIAPDSDFAWFYLVDHRQTHHHKYFTHWPIFWLAAIAASAAWPRVWPRAVNGSFLALVFALGGFLHVLLDSVVGDVWWFAPWLDKPYSLFEVHAHYQPWWLNFILNFSFVGEIVICAAAARIYLMRRSGRLR